MSTQRGMVLLLSLLLTMLLGLLGLSSLHSALLQERMSGNLLVSLQLLEQAETTLRHAEAQLQAGLELAPCRYCQPPPEAGNVQAPGIYRGAGRHSGLVWSASASGLFLIQRLGRSVHAARMPVDEPVMLYRITAVARQGAARTVLESTFALTLAADGPPMQRILWRQVL
ncbi:pilus assembly protein PilX [Pseudomonas laurentiana]|uniref:pilus assembly PilX family protein n=1 Tax=Pseudomonas laurentiana TaxID=2364649 RepID=UPI001675B7A8|nr:hypothetical protein [Pseudomonas laurentiana]GGU72114.1 pilus assembly protein PilX [Pseudomonas laurentiana]